MIAVDKYLDNNKGYSETEAAVLTGFPAGLQRGLVIPAYRESLTTLLRLCEFARQQPGTLLVLVLNRPSTAIQAEDTAWAEALLNHPLLAEPCWQASEHHLSAYPLHYPLHYPLPCQPPHKRPHTCSTPDSHLLVVDRCVSGPPLDAEQGVGLARKIGTDIVCRLIAEQKLCEPWIWQSDADAILPDSYFTALKTTAISQKTAAVIYPFFHQAALCNRADSTDDNTTLATLLYEFSLHYYVAGLTWAGSPYAYHTLGSTLAIHYQHYAQVRGFPKRAGAEDFYILNKLAKTGDIISLAEPSIALQARQSSRVPFGTGPAVKKIASSKTPMAMPLYHPDCFTYLKVMLQLINKLAADGTSSIEQQLEQVLVTAQSTTALDATLLLNIATNTGLEKAWQHSHQHGRTLMVRQQHLQHWFDGFKTLKFIHAVRDSLEVGTISYSEWQQWLPGGFSKPATLLTTAEKITRQLSYKKNKTHQP